MATRKNTVPKKNRLAAPKQGPTASQLGYHVGTLVIYKTRPYHIVAVDRTGMFLTIKRCDDANRIRDNVTLDSVRIVDKRDPLYHKWGLIRIRPDTGRTREDELYVIKALVESTRFGGKEARRELVVETIRDNMWLGVWLRACYDESRDYRLRPEHLTKFKSSKRNPSPMSIFEVLTQLQFHKLKPLQAAMEWLSMLEQMDEDVRPIANMVLDHQFGRISYSDARYGMKETGCVPWLPNRKTGE